MSTFDFGDLAPWFGGGKEAEEEPAPEFDEWKPQRDAFDGFLAAKTKAFDAFEGGDVFEGDGTHDALDQARALLPDQPALRDAFERDVGRLRKTFAPEPPAPFSPSAAPLEDLLGRYAAIPARAPDQAGWVQRRADRLVGTAERLALVDSKTADALMNRFGADASEHLALGTARRGGAKPVLDALADRALFPDLKGGRRKRLRSRLQARLLGEADDAAIGQEQTQGKERLAKLAAAYARAAELAALADRPAAEIEDAAAAAAITPGLRRLLRGLIEQNRAEARREAKGIARVEAALDTGAPLDRDDPADRAAADAHYEAVAPVWRGLEAKARLALVLPYVQSLGLLPKGLVRRLDAALRGTPQDKHAAAGLIGAIARDVPAALADLRPGAVVQA
ncbi:MAG: hypothetical protein JNL66_13445, partial [Alphaproteobacteria bacterium]|nr:hypothetical protein [Alphaproteobacteria bacterium]